VLHIIVRHRCNPHPAYPNQWLDDDRIRSIVTYKEIADLCAPLTATAALVRIHRAGSYDQPPVVCCEGIVKAVRPRDNLFEVEFTNTRALHVTPTIRTDAGNLGITPKRAYQPPRLAILSARQMYPQAKPCSRAAILCSRHPT
jgi:hypothetical protein